MTGETQTIVSLADDFIEKGNDIYLAIENAIKTFKMALKEAMEYEFNSGSRKYRTERNKRIKNLYNEEFEAHKDLVKKIANKRYIFIKKENIHDWEDMLQVGYLALYKAIDSFNQEKHIDREFYYHSKSWGAMYQYIKRHIMEKQKLKGIDYDFEFLSLESYKVNKEVENSYLKDYIKDPADTILEAENNISTNQILEYAKKVNGFKATKSIYPILEFLLVDFDYQYIGEKVECSPSEAYKIYKRFVDRYRAIIKHDIKR